LTIALRFDILRTPSARVTVVTIGRPSGIAATARDTDGELSVPLWGYNDAVGKGYLQ
jgi:hypothetical protein